jgi:hypothetical protein
MKIYIAFICLITSLTTGCALFDFDGTDRESIQQTVMGTDQAVDEFLSGRELDPIEGAWEHDANAFEIVIAKNNFDVATEYDYIGIITRTSQPDWVNGDIKILLRKTSDSNVLDGVWVTNFKSERRMTFVVERDDLVQASYVTTDGETNFVRIVRMSPRFARTTRQ